MSRNTNSIQSLSSECLHSTRQLFISCNFLRILILTIWLKYGIDNQKKCLMLLINVTSKVFYLILLNMQIDQNGRLIYILILFHILDSKNIFNLFFFSQVSWVRKRDSHILTVDKTVFISDPRFRILRLEESGNDWDLHIK